MNCLRHICNRAVWVASWCMCMCVHSPTCANIVRACSPSRANIVRVCSPTRASIVGAQGIICVIIVSTCGPTQVSAHGSTHVSVSALLAQAAGACLCTKSSSLSPLAPPPDRQPGNVGELWSKILTCLCIHVWVKCIRFHRVCIICWMPMKQA